jgi:hypothetical protein
MLAQSPPGSFRPEARTIACLLFVGACSGDPAAGIGASSRPSADLAVPVTGVPDRGDEPAVVAVDVAGAKLCSGSLLAPDVVLTARRCVSEMLPESECPVRTRPAVATRSNDSIRILVGEDVVTAAERARSRGLVLPPGNEACGADIALVLLDQSIDDVQPLAVSATGSAKGSHVRTVGFGLAGGPLPQKLLRDHLRVLDATAEELAVAEASFDRTPGAVAVDETSGQVVGILSRGAVTGGVTCGVYTRADRYLALVEEALAQSVVAPGSTAANRLKAKKGPADLGANCARGADCAAGVCVTLGAERYCSRSCDPHDRCPAHFRCERSEQGDRVCIHT